ncbi:MULTISPECIES: AIPR family protein [Nostoc]|uniref:AIPR family protein n=1 Tax=Nostoc paludosum FACHB-159 TaxID=2692908 RepID=A0ABR8KID4_9NOSO|nr:MULTISPECIES: AIPR family protein [Nostoc]MBD2682984.1 AIPR family protein [Nostoc sp. FACHB-857]MBD2739324.1 AIPR family protein [Nostoc paludosum FACHB-159]
MPKNWTLKVDQYINANSNCIIATADVDSFPTDLPLEPNIREPNLKSSTYRQIFDSLTSEPEKFFQRNNGIVLCVNKVKPKNKTELELEILQTNEGGNDGIINGGHSVSAFEQARKFKYDLTKARVKVTIHIGLSEDEAKDIALASNTSAPVDARSKVNARGDYKFIKQFLGQLEMEEETKFRIAYYQNQSGAPKSPQCNVNHLIKLMNCLDRNKYNPNKSKGKHPPVSNNPSLSDAERQRLSKLLPLLPKGLWIEQRLFQIIEEHITNPRKKGTIDLASIDARKSTLLPDSRYSFGFGAPADIAMPIVAAYRVFLDENYNWIIPFDEFALDFLQHLWANYYKKYLVSEKLAGNTVGSKICRNPVIWDNLYVCAQSYLNQQLLAMVSSNNNKREELKLAN